MLQRVVERCQVTGIPVAVATPDETIADFCNRMGWACYKGSEDDVLDRYYQCATEHNASPVIRITADNPLVDPLMIQSALNVYLMSHVDYVSNNINRTFPMGLDVQVMSFSTLERAWKESKTREHVTDYIYTHPKEFRIREIKSKQDYSSMRWTVDTKEDLKFIRKIYEHFGETTFTWLDVVDYLTLHPELMDINKDIQQKPI